MLHCFTLASTLHPCRGTSTWCCVVLGTKITQLGRGGEHQILYHSNNWLPSSSQQLVTKHKVSVYYFHIHSGAHLSNRLAAAALATDPLPHHLPQDRPSAGFQPLRVVHWHFPSPSSAENTHAAECSYVICTYPACCSRPPSSRERRIQTVQARMLSRLHTSSSSIIPACSTVYFGRMWLGLNTSARKLVRLVDRLFAISNSLLRMTCFAASASSSLSSATFRADDDVWKQINDFRSSAASYKLAGNHG